MEFASDNTGGIAPPILDAIARAGEGHAPSYGADEASARLDAAFGGLSRETGRAFIESV